MSDLRLIVLSPLLLLALICMSSCAPQEKGYPEGYPVGSQISVIYSYYSAFSVKTKLVVEKYPDKGQYDRPNDSIFHIQFSEEEQKSLIQSLKLFSNSSIYPNHFILKVIILKKELNVYPKSDIYTVDIVDETRTTERPSKRR